MYAPAPNVLCSVWLRSKDVEKSVLLDTVPEGQGQVLISFWGGRMGVGRQLWWWWGEGV